MKARYSWSIRATGALPHLKFKFSTAGQPLLSSLPVMVCQSPADVSYCCVCVWKLAPLPHVYIVPTFASDSASWSGSAHLCCASTTLTVMGATYHWLQQRKLHIIWDKWYGQMTVIIILWYHIDCQDFLCRIVGFVVQSGAWNSLWDGFSAVIQEHLLQILTMNPRTPDDESVTVEVLQQMAIL